MAFTINRIMAETGDEAFFEIVSTGNGGAGDVSTIDIDGGAPYTGLAGGPSDPVTWGGTLPNAEVLGLSAFVCGPINGFVTLAWSVSGVFLTLPHGQTELSLKFTPPNVGEDIIITSVEPAGINVPFTLRLRVRKRSGFAFSSVKP